MLLKEAVAPFAGRPVDGHPPCMPCCAISREPVSRPRPALLAWRGVSRTSRFPGRALADLGQMAIAPSFPSPGDIVWQRAGFPSTPDRRRRLAVLCEAYGAEPSAVVDAAQVVRRTELDQLRRLAGQGVEPYVRFLARGDDRSMSLSYEWLERHRDQLL